MNLRSFPLTDALGSTIALTDSSGAIQTQYAYEPFGATTPSGATSSNWYQFTGRENDGTGLYYYRARYHSPRFQRFISQDPAGLAGGVNFYAYAGDSPVNFGDPFGLKPNPCQSILCSPVFWQGVGIATLAVAAPEALPLELAAAAATGMEAEWIATPYGVEVQSLSTEAQAALAQAQNGVTLYRTGQLGQSMTGESQYWSLDNPALNPDYANATGMPAVTPDFIMTGTLNPEASVVTNEAPGLGANAGRGIQVVTSPGGVGNLGFHMP